MTNPYQPYLDIIDTIIRKASTSGKVIIMHVMEIPSLPQNSGGVTEMNNFLLQLKDGKVIAGFERTAGSFRIPNLTNTQLQALKKGKDRFLHEDRTAEGATETIKPTVNEPVSLDVLYYVSRGYNGEIIVNGKYELLQPHSGRSNDLVFEYLCANPNKKFNRQQIEEAIGKSIGKSFNVIVNQFHFTKELRRLFFPRVSNVSIELRNNLTKEDILKANIDEKKLTEQIKKLKLWKEKF
jgi:hypothetical protein